MQVVPMQDGVSSLPPPTATATRAATGAGFSKANAENGNNGSKRTGQPFE
jgi:hypothetical protein